MERFEISGSKEMTTSSTELTESLATHREAILRYIRSIVRDEADAEDLVQETLLRAYDKLSSLEDPARLVPWLYRIATNVTHDRFRSASHRHRPLPLDENSGGEGAPDSLKLMAVDSTRLDKVMEQREMSSCVQQYIEDLSDPHRAVVMLHDVQGLTNPEIAAMLGVSLATVKIRLHRARTKLRAALGEGCTFSSDERGVRVCEPRRSRDLEGAD